MTRLAIALLSILFLAGVLPAAELAGFSAVGPYDEQEREGTFTPNVRYLVNAPPADDFREREPLDLILYALPNGNTIEQTAGKRRGPGVHWRYDIQHIAAQTRWLRRAMPEKNIAVAYLEAEQKSWPAWRRETPRADERIAELTRFLGTLFPNPEVSCHLASHSGGGSLMWGYLNAHETLPSELERMAFLDSNYSFSVEQEHGDKLVKWLKASPEHTLVVLAYDDREVMLDGKKVVSDTGGTWRATERMIGRLEQDFPLEESEDGPFLVYTHPRIDIRLHRNPDNKILHTALVGDMNGYIHAMTVNTGAAPKADAPGSPRIYTQLIDGGPFTTPTRTVEIPPRPADAPTGTEFIEQVKDLPTAQREAAIREQLLSGNVPGFLRELRTIEVEAAGIEGTTHHAAYQAMPDYLAIGSDEDYVRMPMGPYSAQAFCDAFDFVLPTRKMADDIWEASEAKLAPRPLTEEREAPETFLQHHEIIEDQLAGEALGVFVAGIKKDVVVSDRLQERDNRVAIYGWHYQNGQAIQPLSIVHVDWYVDYSHGIRPVRRMMEVDGNQLPYDEILRDPHLHPLLSDEGTIDSWRYDDD